MSIALKRIYEFPTAADGTRILVERLWPRGISKEGAAVDYWAKDTAPSHELRKWFNHNPERWEEFKRLYYTELDESLQAVEQLRSRLAAGPATFVFASREAALNNAVALKGYMER